MDPVTHAFAGAAAAPVAVARPLGKAAWLPGAVGALLPDAEALVRSTADPPPQCRVHRHFTHALAWNWISIVDPVFTVIVLTGVTVALWRRSTGPAAVALTGCAVYLGAGALQESHARRAWYSEPAPGAFRYVHLSRRS